MFYILYYATLHFEESQPYYESETRGLNYRLAERRRRLQQKLETFCRDAAKHLGEDVSEFEEHSMDEASFSEEPEDDDPSFPHSQNDSEPENWRIPLPSAVPPQTTNHNRHISELLDREHQLRKGRANDALQGVRETLCQLSWQHRFRV